MRKLGDKKGAIELSIGTIVILVLSMSMLILGLVLLRSIFTGATQSVDTLQGKVQTEIINLFGDENKEVVVRLGSDKTAKIKVGAEDFGIGIGARTQDGSTTDRERLKYKLTLSKNENDNCVRILGERQTESLFNNRIGDYISFDEFSSDSAFARVSLTIPKGTVLCSQKVLVDVQDTQNSNSNIGGTFFNIQIIRGGIGGIF